MLNIKIILIYYNYSLYKLRSITNIMFVMTINMCISLYIYKKQLYNLFQYRYTKNQLYNICLYKRERQKKIEQRKICICIITSEYNENIYICICLYDFFSLYTKKNAIYTFVFV